MATLRALRVMLERPSAPHHGYDLQLRTGVRGIYRVLQRLEEDGWAISEWMAPPGRGPARHVYRLTPAGRRWARKLLAETAALLAPPSLLQQPGTRTRNRRRSAEGQSFAEPVCGPRTLRARGSEAGTAQAEWQGGRRDGSAAVCRPRSRGGVVSLSVDGAGVWRSRCATGRHRRGQLLVREGAARLLAVTPGIEVEAAVADLPSLLSTVEAAPPHAVLTESVCLRRRRTRGYRRRGGCGRHIRTSAPSC